MCKIRVIANYKNDKKIGKPNISASCYHKDKFDIKERKREKKVLIKICCILRYRYI